MFSRERKILHSYLSYRKSKSSHQGTSVHFSLFCIFVAPNNGSMGCKENQNNFALYYGILSSNKCTLIFTETRGFRSKYVSLIFPNSFSIVSVFGYGHLTCVFWQFFISSIDIYCLFEHWFRWVWKLVGMVLVVLILTWWALSTFLMHEVWSPSFSTLVNLKPSKAWGLAAFLQHKVVSTE